jgi:putative toxin-antitoxin system antitoxin component (TIGR02293 family)
VKPITCALSGCFHEPLTIPETDRALRLARATTEAARVFGDPDKVARWLRKPNASLGGQTPLSLLRSETGAKAVEEILIQIDHGIFA